LLFLKIRTPDFLRDLADGSGTMSKLHLLPVDRRRHDTHAGTAYDFDHRIRSCAERQNGAAYISEARRF